MLAGGDVGDEVQFLGSAFTIEHTQLIYIFAIVLFLWFFYRYHLVAKKWSRVMEHWRTAIRDGLKGTLLVHQLIRRHDPTASEPEMTGFGKKDGVPRMAYKRLIREGTFEDGNEFDIDLRYAFLLYLMAIPWFVWKSNQFALQVFPRMFAWLTIIGIVVNMNWFKLSDATLWFLNRTVQ